MIKLNDLLHLTDEQASKANPTGRYDGMVRNQWAAGGS